MSSDALLKQWWKYLIVLAAFAVLVGVVVYWGLPASDGPAPVAALPGFRIPRKAADLSYQQVAEEGEQVAQQLLADMPHSAAAHETAAYYYARRAQTTRAIELYRKCIQLDNTRLQPRVKLAELLIKQGDPGSALPILREAVKQPEATADVHQQLALALHKAGDFQQAVATIQSGTEAFPRDAAIWLAAGRIYAEQGKLQQSRTSLATAIQLDPQRAESYYAMANVLRELGDQKAAQQYSAIFAEKSAAQPAAAREQQLQLFRETTSLALLAAAAHYETSDAAVFITLCQRAAEMAPQQTLTYHKMAAFFLKNGRLQQARVLHSHLVKIEPGRPANYLNLASLYSRLGEDKKVAATLTAGVQQCPQDAILRDTFALYLLQAGRLQESREQIEQALRIEPSKPRRRMLEIITGRQRGNAPQAAGRQATPSTPAPAAK